MPTATDRLLQAHAHFEEALAALQAAHHALPDEEYTALLPSVLLCGYKPQQQEGSFVLLGHVTHLAQVLCHSLNDPRNAPFRDTFLEVLEQGLLSRVPY